MERLVIEISVMVALVWAVLHYRTKYQNSVIRHRDAAVMWRKMMLSIVGEQIGTYFPGSPIHNYVFRVKNEQIEIMIGDDEHMVAVDMDSFREDGEAALDEAYNRFMANVR